MGLTSHSTGMKSVDSGLNVKKQNPKDKIVAIAGNPNVGKSTVFNNLTGMRQHTGNWPGKTVANAQGYCKTEKNSYVMIDIPLDLLLMAHSAEEEVARDFICFEEPDAVIVVCDACCLERNLNLVLQTMEITDRVVVCINLMDEAGKEGNLDRCPGDLRQIGGSGGGSGCQKRRGPCGTDEGRRCRCRRQMESKAVKNRV